MVMCFAPTCKHYSERTACTFFAFPKDPKELKKWIRLIRRKDRQPGKYSRICSCHFVDGDRKNGPTRFDYNVSKQFETPECVAPSKRKRSMASATVTASSSATSSSMAEPLVDIDTYVQAVQQEEQDQTQEYEEVGVNVEAEVTKEIVAQSEVPPSSAMLEAEKYFLEQEVERLRNELKQLSLQFSFKHIENNDHMISVYTGLPRKEIFGAVFALFENRILIYFAGWNVVRVPKIDQLLLTLMKLKLNLVNDDLAQRFNICRDTVANIFKTWLYALHEVVFEQLMVDIPSRNKNKMCMPNSFSTFTNCRVIIDCTEMSTIHPTNMEKQRATYSSYKHRNTLKALVGVAPNGVITFVSKLYPGSISDKKITKHCGVLPKLTAGDLVLADKGFLIADILPEGVSLNLPPFLTKSQFTKEEVTQTRTIAKARIHVERAIRRVKAFKILSLIPQTLMPHASVVLRVCASLTNLQFPLIKEVEHLYDY